MAVVRSGWRALALCGALAIGLSAALADDDPFRPDTIEQWVRDLGWRCMISATCPVSNSMMDLIKRGIAHEREAQYRLGVDLFLGRDGFPMDQQAAVLWTALAAERGDPTAARDVARQLRNGSSLKVDETKIATALKPQVEKGDVESMRALAPMIIGGRGTKQDVAAGLAMLKAAADKGSSDAEKDLSQLYLYGGPGVPANRPEAMRWLATSARPGNIDGMYSLGYMALSSAPGSPKDATFAYCWIVRAAMLDDKAAQEKLSWMFVLGEKDDHGTAVPIDLLQADFWFKLAAQSPYHDNPQIRARIEPKMTTAQLDDVKRQVDAWQPKKFGDLKGLAIALPGGGRNCSPF